MWVILKFATPTYDLKVFQLTMFSIKWRKSFLTLLFAVDLKKKFFVLDRTILNKKISDYDHWRWYCRYSILFYTLNEKIWFLEFLLSELVKVKKKFFWYIFKDNMYHYHFWENVNKNLRLLIKYKAMKMWLLKRISWIEKVTNAEVQRRTDVNQKDNNKEEIVISRLYPAWGEIWVSCLIMKSCIEG